MRRLELDRVGIALSVALEPDPQCSLSAKSEIFKSALYCYSRISLTHGLSSDVSYISKSTFDTVLGFENIFGPDETT